MDKSLIYRNLLILLGCHTSQVTLTHFDVQMGLPLWRLNNTFWILVGKQGSSKGVPPNPSKRKWKRRVLGKIVMASTVSLIKQIYVTFARFFLNWHFNHSLWDNNQSVSYAYLLIVQSHLQIVYNITTPYQSLITRCVDYGTQSTLHFDCNKRIRVFLSWSSNLQRVILSFIHFIPICFLKWEHNPFHL